MRVGYSVGDFAALEQLASKTFEACKEDAPEGFKDISQGVLVMHTWLSRIGGISSGAPLSAAQQSYLEDIRNGCGAILEDLQAILDRYKGRGKKSKRIWDRLGWGSNDIAELRSRLLSNTALMTAYVK